MSAVVKARSRLLSVISRNTNRRFSSTATTEPPKEPIVSSSSILGDQPPPAPEAPAPPPPSAGTEKKSFSFLKYALTAAITGGVATAGYATYGSFLFHSNFFLVDSVDEH